MGGEGRGSFRQAGRQAGRRWFISPAPPHSRPQLPAPPPTPGRHPCCAASRFPNRLDSRPGRGGGEIRKIQASGPGFNHFIQMQKLSSQVRGGDFSWSFSLGKVFFFPPFPNFPTLRLPLADCMEGGGGGCVHETRLVSGQRSPRHFPTREPPQNFWSMLALVWEWTSSLAIFLCTRRRFSSPAVWGPERRARVSLLCGPVLKSFYLTGITHIGHGDTFGVRLLRDVPGNFTCEKLCWGGPIVVQKWK